jgi:UDP-N-acetylglucosamine 2-epimerase (non-hydrolysing)
MTRVVHVVAARPNYMKIAPVWSGLASYDVEQTLIHTGQHYDESLKDVFFGELALPAPHVELEVGSGSHGAQTARALVGLEESFVRLEPDLVVVPGDVNSTLAAALAAAKLEIPVCHVESGLRSHDRSMPEEHNRRLTDHLSSLLLTTSADADSNLAHEGITEGVRLVGNTMIDSLTAARPFAEELADWRQFGLERGRYVLVTLHRPALVDDPELLRSTIVALTDLSETYPVVFPVHPRTQQRIATFGIVVPPGVSLAPPLTYSRFLSLELGAAAVVTDSGGVQEETTALGVRCFTLRANTERPVTIDQGTNTILGLEPERIADVPALLEEPRSPRVPPLWDGKAGERAAAAIAALLGVPRRELGLSRADQGGGAVRAND